MFIYFLCFYSAVDQCPDISASVNNAPVCDGYNDNFKTCTPGCNSGTALPRPSPDFYTCGPEGKFNGFNYFLPFQTPSCGSMLLYFKAELLSFVNFKLRGCEVF